MKEKTFIIIILLILIGGLIIMGIFHERIVASRDKGMAEDWNANHQITGDVDMDQYSWENQVIENLGAFPGGPIEGQIVWRSDTNELYIYDGAAWDLLNPTITKSQLSSGTIWNLAGLAWANLAGITITHNSTTGKVLVMLSTSLYSSGGDTIFIRLTKDGAPINRSVRQVGHTGLEDVEAGAAIQYYDGAAGNNTWKIQYITALGNLNHFRESIFTIIDIV